MNMHDYITPYTIEILKTSQNSLIYAYDSYSKAVSELISVFERNADKLVAHAETLNSVISTFDEARIKVAEPLKELCDIYQEIVDAYTEIVFCDGLQG